MGPITVVDKSFLQSLSVDESVFFDHFFNPIITPLFFIETLADLEKAVRQGRTPEQEVGIIASKAPEASSFPIIHHTRLALANLMGVNITMDGRPLARRLGVRLYWMWRNGWEYSEWVKFGSNAGQLGTGHGV